MSTPPANGTQKGCALLIWQVQSMAVTQLLASHAKGSRILATLPLRRRRKRRTAARLPAEPSASVRASAALTAAFARG
jgi:hypothetical protein